MYKKMTLKKLFKAAVLFTISALIIIFSFCNSKSEENEARLIIRIINLMVSSTLIFIGIISLVYPIRLKHFINKFDIYLRKSVHKLDGKYYWYKDYFLDLTRLKTIDYNDINRLKVIKSSVGLGGGRGNMVRIPLSVTYFIKVSYGFKSIIINVGDSEEYCRQLINIFKQKNNKIEIKTL